MSAARMTTTCRACGAVIPDNQPAALDPAGFFHHLDCLPASTHVWEARDRQLVALRLASPKRADVGQIVADQADAGHLPLFGAASQPVLL